MQYKAIVIHIDTGGGDYSQLYVAQACHIFLQEVSQSIYFRLYITKEYQEQITQLFDQDHRVEIIICDHELRNADTYKAKNDTTMENAIHDLYDIVDDNMQHIALFCGNTKHASMIAFRKERKMPGALDLPSAIIGEIYTPTSYRIMTDIGASIQVNLLQLAMISGAFLQTFYNIQDYKIGFLNIGTEYNKGLPEIVNAAQLYAQYTKQMHIYGEYGFIEPNELLMDNGCHAIITNGFNGNIVIKAWQGVTQHIKDYIKNNVSIVWQAMGYPALQSLKSGINTKAYNGGLLSKFSKPIVKSHGNSTHEAIVYALRRICNLYAPNFEKFYTACKKIPQQYKILMESHKQNVKNNSNLTLAPQELDKGQEYAE